MRGELSGGIPQIRDVGSFNGGWIRPRGNDSGHGVHAAGLEPGGVGDGRLDTLPELGFASGDTGDASLTRAPIARSEIEKNVLEVVAAKALLNNLRREIEWKEVFHSFEAGIGRGGETVEEGHLVEHHGKIRCKFEHEVIIPHQRLASASAVAFARW